MSPTDPISTDLTSSIDTSPITPTHLDRPMQFEPSLPSPILISANNDIAVPATPIIAPSVFLPPLITSFPVRHRHRISSEIQFVLPTPSPLALGSQFSSNSPQTAVLVLAHGRTFTISTSCCSSPASLVSPPLVNEIQTARTNPYAVSPSSPGQNPIRSPMVGSSKRRTPTLRRENAMEGLERMELEMDIGFDASSPEAEETVQLPLRSKTRDSSSHAATSVSNNESDPVVGLTVGSVSPAARLQASTVSRSADSRTTTVVKAANSRSPIRKHRRRYTRASSSSSAPRLVVREPPTATQQYLVAALTHLIQPLIPLVSITTGLPHPEFPRTLLSYHLLTHEQLDRLARFYHQTIDAGWERWMYPSPLVWGKSWCGSQPVHAPSAQNMLSNRRILVDLETKRRRWGRFIGLQGCESPVHEDSSEGGDDGGVRQGQGQVQDYEDVVVRMETEWERALRRAEEENRVREKMWGRRF